MRLWHYKLIPALPRQQLLGQWRECCLIAKSISENGTPNHILVDPIMEYDSMEFLSYCKKVQDEMQRRGYLVNTESLTRHLSQEAAQTYKNICPCYADRIFIRWHTNKYLIQCYYNLEEKHDRGGITDIEWRVIQDAYIRAAGER